MRTLVRRLAVIERRHTAAASADVITAYLGNLVPIFEQMEGEPSMWPIWAELVDAGMSDAMCFAYAAWQEGPRSYAPYVAHVDPLVRGGSV